MTHRGRRITTLLTSALGSAVLVAFGLVHRDTLVELWYLHRLGAADPDDRLLATHELGKRGTGRAVPPLLEAVREDEFVRSAALRALAKIAPRARRELQTQIAEEFFRRAKEDDQEAAKAVRAICLKVPAALPVVAKLLHSEKETDHVLGAVSLVDAWPQSKTEIWRLSLKLRGGSMFATCHRRPLPCAATTRRFSSMTERWRSRHPSRWSGRTRDGRVWS